MYVLPGNLVYGDVVYENDADVWACCGATDDNVHCNTPTTITFLAEAPSEISTTWTVSTLVTEATSSSATTTSSSAGSQITGSLTSPSSSTTSTSTTSATSTSQADTSKSGQLSTGATIAIAVVCAIVGLVGCGFGVLWCRRYRAKRRQESIPPEPYQIVEEQDQSELPGSYSYTQAPGELDANEVRVELPAHQFAQSFRR